MGSAAAPAAFVEAGMLSVTAPAGETGEPPLDGNWIVSEAAGLPPLVASGVPLAVM